MKIRLTALLLLGFFCLESGAQSLPDIARRERERRQQGPSGRLFTNENIAQIITTAVVTSAVATSSATAAPRTVTPPQRTDERGEQAWRQLFSDARDELARAQDRATLTEQELVELNRRLLQETGTFNREGILLPQIQEKRDELEAATARINEANQAIEDLREELRRAGAPASWGRP